jgi:CheY-like chemotaxis protein
MKVLIIDDEEDIRRIAHLSLGKVGGMDVLDAGGGSEGVRKAENEKPDVILLDMMMPKMDGRATLAALRDNPTTSSIPVIFLTAKAMRSEVEQLMQSGATGVLTKPFDPMTLASQVRAILESK